MGNCMPLPLPRFGDEDIFMLGFVALNEEATNVTLTRIPFLIDCTKCPPYLALAIDEMLSPLYMQRKWPKITI